MKKETDFLPIDMWVVINMVDAARIKSACAADQAMDFITFG
jgi:uncharacterized protein YaeQ